MRKVCFCIACNAYLTCAVWCRIPRPNGDDPLSAPLTSAQYSDAEFCIALRFPDLLLFASLMQRPRRDMGMIKDFANTMAEYCMQLLPRSIFPFECVPMTRIDPIDDGRQVR